MSWDVVLFSSSEKITSIEEIDESKFIPVDFYAGYKKYFIDLKFNDNNSTIVGDGFSIVYYDKPNELSSNTILNLYGEKAIYALIDISKKYGWQIFDTGLGEMIDLENPSKTGYANFQAYLNHVLNK